MLASFHTATRPELETLFVENLPTIRRILSGLSRRQGMLIHDAEDFASWAIGRLMENDYAMLRKFRGDASLSTYLAAVLAGLAREYRVTHWGRWRPSAAARRAGTVGIRLETLIQRDGVSLAQAGQILRTTGVTTLSDRHLAGLAAHFPRRTRPKPIELQPSSIDAMAPDRSDAAIDQEESVAEIHSVRSALRNAMGTLASDELQLLRMHFADAMSIADIARGLAVPQKPLYRRMDRALAALRARLETNGVSREHVRSMLYAS
jgi:RNA polymerase sigma factor for flagellar operon FliA